MTKIRQRLNDVASRDYAVFHKKIAATNKAILGVKLPVLRKMSREFSLEEIEAEDMSVYENFMLYCLAVMRLKYEDLIPRLDAMLCEADSWVYVDCSVAGSKALKDNAEKLPYDLEFLLRGGTFAKRFYIVAALWYFPFSDKAMDDIAALSFGDYYVDMAAAWYISVLFTLDFGKATEYFARFPALVKKLTVRKCLDSFRLSKEQKAEIRALRVD